MGESVLVVGGEEAEGREENAESGGSKGHQVLFLPPRFILARELQDRGY